MYDMILCKNGDHAWDLDLTEDGDIKIEEDILQNVRTVLGWIYGEWRLGPELGVPWFEDIWVKKPNLTLIGQELTNAARDVEGVTDAEVKVLKYNSEERTLKVHLTITEENGTTVSEEATLGA